MSPDTVVATVIGDIALVTLASALLGQLARRCGQPAVIGQILTGVLLGPSLLGRLPGHLTARLFPPYAVPYLSVLAQVAVVIFMFAVGYEIELRSLRGHGRAVPLVAAGALLVPLSLGAGAVLLLGRQFEGVGEQGVGRGQFVLFMAVTLAITALPVLAAIVRERGLAGTTAGVVASAAAGVMDVAAWLMLAAALIGTSHAPGRPWPVTAALVLGFAAVMLLVVRPLLPRWTSGRLLLSSPVAIAFVLAMGSAWVTAALGLHPVFGGFLAGLAMRGPNRPADADLLRSLDRAGGLLLPLFFVVTGLSLNLSSLHGDALVLLAVLLAVAVAGKLGPGYLASRLGGLTRRQSATVAALVNTRGLTELIALNVGLSAGLIDQELFSVLVLMALVTTLMTGPLLSLIRPSVSPAPEPSLQTVTRPGGRPDYGL